MQQHAVAHITTGGTSQLVAAPGTGRRIRVTSLHVSPAATGALTLGFSATNQRVWNFPVDGEADVSVMDWRGDANAALSVTTPGTGPTDVTADYEVESAP